jgi:putative ABC transport system permease protein
MLPLVYSVRSLTARGRITVPTALGFALVVFLSASVQMFRAGLQGVLRKSGAPEMVLVLQDGASAELGSVIDETTIGTLLSNAAIARDAKGNPQAMSEVVASVRLPMANTAGAATTADVQVRGIRDGWNAARPEVRIVAGRAIQSGAAEAMVGAAVWRRFAGLDLNGTLDLPGYPGVKVVGVFSASGSSFESELWADLDTVRSAFGLQGSVSAVRARLISPAAFENLKADVEANRQLGLQVMRESSYYERQAGGMNSLQVAMASIVAGFCSLCAMLGATITMYTSTANRRREVATLRALGFSRLSVLLSFLFESALLAVGGGLVGVLASLIMQWVPLSLRNAANGSVLVVTFRPGLYLLWSLAIAAMIGLIGGLLPALRAARMKPVEAMHR